MCAGIASGRCYYSDYYFYNYAKKMYQKCLEVIASAWKERCIMHYTYRYIDIDIYFKKTLNTFKIIFIFSGNKYTASNCHFSILKFQGNGKLGLQGNKYPAHSYSEGELFF